MQNNKNSISVTELLKELKENGFKKISDEYVDKVVFFPEFIGTKKKESIQICTNLNREFIKECARVSKGLSLQTIRGWNLKVKI